MQYVALLRGINVGGNNIIPMAELRSCFEAMDFADVQTYIQTGNVVFSTSRTAAAQLNKKIAAGLQKEFGYENPILVLSQSQYEQVLAEVPRGYGTKPEKYRYDVIFLIPPLTSAEAMKDLPLRDGVDQVAAGTRALYFWRVKGQESKSQLHKLVGLKMYKNVTIRNWNTTKKISEKFN